MKQHVSHWNIQESRLSGDSPFSCLLLCSSVQWQLGSATAELCPWGPVPSSQLSRPAFSELYYNLHPLSICTRLSKLRIFTHSNIFKNATFISPSQCCLSLSQLTEDLQSSVYWLYTLDRALCQTHQKLKNRFSMIQRIPWMEEPGRLKSMGSLRVRHDWVTSLSLFTFGSHRVGHLLKRLSSSSSSP